MSEGPGGGRGKWSEDGVPHRGWVCVEYYDTGPDQLETCEMCESVEARYIHVMANDRWPETLACGCICASHMSGDFAAAEQREKSMRSDAGRRARFPKRAGWKISSKGTPYIKVDGIHLMIAKKGDGRFQVAVTAPGQPTKWGSRRYATIEDAQRGCFDAWKVVQDS